MRIFCEGAQDVENEICRLKNELVTRTAEQVRAHAGRSA